MVYNSHFIIICLILATFSFLCSGFVVLAHFKIPQLLKHPGNLIVVLCIAQMLFDIHWLTTFPAALHDIKNDSICTNLGFINVIWFFSTWNLVTSLSLELIIKIKFPLNTGYSFRMKIYFIGTLILTALENLIIYSVGEFGLSDLDTCAIKNHSAGEYIYSIIIFGNLPIMWISIFIVLKSSTAKNNKALKSLTLVIFSMTITWGMPALLPLISKLFGDQNIDFNYFSILCGCSSGIFISVCRLATPQMVVKMKEVFCRRLSKKKANRNDGSKEEIMNQLSLNSFFESITEDTIRDILLGLSLICLTKKCAEVHYSYAYKKQKYIFKSDDFIKLKQCIIYNLEQQDDLGIWEYEPETFKNIRKNCNINLNSILKSICTDQNFLSTKNFNTGGRSNAFIFCTHNENIIIKTLTRKEKYLLLDILPAYNKRIMKYPESKIVRIFGLYKIRTSKHCFIVMENILRNKNQAVIFDLKGSIDDRYVKNTENIYGKVFKDQNFLEMGKNIEIESDLRIKILNTLIDDSVFFRKLNIIDYSILVGFYEEKENIGIRYYIDGIGEKSYCIGIIDFLQEYTIWKKIELLIKRLEGKVNASVCSPSKYSERFVEFLKKIFNKIE
ncbi:hypothetical protein SteCoe_1858 [Stentor coeruleus]|uniref:PIPK domain-containing protein n=1 Tax=Stentor coeruleus TaxID=5963 RepID=A0A1R2D0P7_9CILI|nr:hypothetical protein SteCoe_1858 [Stentor coeruleus]